MGYPWGKHHHDDDDSSSFFPYSHYSPSSFYIPAGAPGEWPSYSSWSTRWKSFDHDRHHASASSSDLPSQTTYNAQHHAGNTISTKPYWPSMYSEHHFKSSSSLSSSTSSAMDQQKPTLQNGTLAAAIILPVLAFLSAITLIGCCLRRRSSRNRGSPNPTHITPAAMKEKLGSFRRSQNPPPPPSPPAEPHILTTEMNNAYFTGLDTSSFGSRGTSGEYQPRTSDEPPPPYIRDLSPPPPLSTEYAGPSPFDDQEEGTGAYSDGFLPLERGAGASIHYANDVPSYEVGGDARNMGESYTSDTASLRIGGGSTPQSNPFEDPVSPVGSTHGDRRRGSDVSEMDERG